MSARVSAAISALWMFASAQKTIHLSYCGFTGGRPALLAGLACPANAVFGARAELAYGGAGGCDPCISGYF